MDRSAKVTSFDAVHALRTSLVGFQGEARDAVTLLTLEVRRAVDWLENDRRRYWPEQARKAAQKLTVARNELERCQLKYGSEETPSCYEQKKAVERAKRRLRLCEEKIRVVKRWIQTVRRELNEFEGQIAQMNDTLDSDVPRAIATLERMLTALEKYAASSAPASANRPSGTTQTPANGNAETAPLEQPSDDATQ
jgi:hypothetical protein